MKPPVVGVGQRTDNGHPLTAHQIPLLFGQFGPGVTREQVGLDVTGAGLFQVPRPGGGAHCRPRSGRAQ